MKEGNKQWKVHYFVMGGRQSCFGDITLLCVSCLLVKLSSKYTEVRDVHYNARCMENICPVSASCFMCI